MSQSWFGYEAEEFVFSGRKGIIVFPHEAVLTREWALKTEYWGAFPGMEIALLEKGFHIAFFQNQTRFATESECAEKAEFCRYLIQTYALSPKCILIGMSCGGAHALTFAGLYPDFTKGIILDAPVVNYLSYPGNFDVPGNAQIWEKEFLEAYPGMKRYQLLHFSNHPISRVEVLLENRIPILMMYGTQDTAVPYEENGRLLEEAYQGTEGLMHIIPRQLQGHHPHGLNDLTPVLEFAAKICRLS